MVSLYSRQDQKLLCAGSEGSWFRTCKGVDAPQSPHQADAHHKGEEHHAHHGSRLQRRAWRVEPFNRRLQQQVCGRMNDTHLRPPAAPGSGAWVSVQQGASVVWAAVK